MYVCICLDGYVAPLNLHCQNRSPPQPVIIRYPFHFYHHPLPCCRSRASSPKPESFIGVMRRELVADARFDSKNLVELDPGTTSSPTPRPPSRPPEPWTPIAVSSGPASASRA